MQRERFRHANGPGTVALRQAWDTYKGLFRRKRDDSSRLCIQVTGVLPGLRYVRNVDLLIL